MHTKAKKSKDRSSLRAKQSDADRGEKHLPVTVNCCSYGYDFLLTLHGFVGLLNPVTVMVILLITPSFSKHC